MKKDKNEIPPKSGKVRVWKNGVLMNGDQDQSNRPGAVSTSSSHSGGATDVKVIKAIGKMDLERKMNKLMAQGYVPSGGPTVANADKTTFFMGQYTQVMIKY